MINYPWFVFYEPFLFTVPKITKTELITLLFK